MRGYIVIENKSDMCCYNDLLRKTNSHLYKSSDNFVYHTIRATNNKLRLDAVSFRNALYLYNIAISSRRYKDAKKKILSGILYIQQNRTGRRIDRAIIPLTRSKIIRCSLSADRARISNTTLSRHVSVGAENLCEQQKLCNYTSSPRIVS